MEPIKPLKLSADFSDRNYEEISFHFPSFTDEALVTGRIAMCQPDYVRTYPFELRMTKRGTK